MEIATWVAAPRAAARAPHQSYRAALVICGRTDLPMKLREVSITNFRSIKQLAFRFPDDNLLVLVGPNNAGKSNIIRAIDAICGEGWFGRDKMEDHDFYQRDRRTPFKITLTFDNGSSAELSSAERWTSYRDRNGRPIYQSQGNIKDDFPCTYLGADRTFDEHLALDRKSV